MTYCNYQWTAFTEADLLASGLNGTDFGCGDKFVMPSCATVKMSTWDDDGVLEGDNSWWYGDNSSEDRYGQDAYVNGVAVGCKMFAEQYHVLQGSNGCTYYMIEILVEGHDSPGAGNGYFTFYGATPPAGVTLTVTNTCNVSGCWVNYSCIGAGPSAPPNTPPTFTNVPADGVFCVNENTKLIIDLNATDANNDALSFSIVGGTDAGKFVIDASTGVLNFVTAPDYEAPTDSDKNNSYQVIVAVSDGKGGVTNKCLTVNVCNVDEGGTTPPTCTVIEAESMQLCGFAVGSSSNTSGGKFIYTLNNGVTYATTTYSGAAGTYDLTLRSFDQIGESYVSVWVNGVKVGSYGELNDDCNWEEHVLKNVVLKPGDVIEIRGSDCGTNYIDYLKICPSAPTTGNLEGRVFLDANKNGVDDAEAGVGGVVVTLLDSTGKVVGTTTTLADGSYKFTNLPAGNYTVAFPTSVDGKVLTTQNVGTNDAIDSDANVSTGLTGSVSVVAGATTKDVDAGIKDPGTAAINGRLFDDANKNNVDDGEPGVGGVTVKLLDGAGNVIKTTTTAADGSYSFGGLDAGTYTVEFPTSVNGKVLVNQNIGTNDAIDSDASETTGRTDPISVAIGETKTDNDAGVKDPGTAAITGRLFDDANGNNVDDGEPGVGGVTVNLLDAAGNVVGTTTTAADGSYAFEWLNAGTYRVQFPTSVNGKVLVNQNVGGNDAIDSDANTATGVTDPITVAIGQTKTDNDAGIKDPGTAQLSGRVFVDANGNNVDDGEAGAAGVTVNLLNSAGTVVGTTTTAADGSYAFTGLKAGTYSVQFPTSVNGRVLVSQDVGGNDAIDSDANPTTGRTGPITLAIGDNKPDNDAGLKDPGTAALTGRIFVDANGNNVDDGEAGAAGVTVNLLNSAGTVIGTTTTAADGSYAFTGLNAGDYRVQFPTSVNGKVLVSQNVGSNDAIDSDANQATGVTDVISLAIGQTKPDNDAGIKDPGTASLSGRVFIDTNKNNVDDAETGAAGVSVNLLDAAGNVVKTTTTAADGSYSFTGLGAGTYSVQFPTSVNGRVLVSQDVGGNDAIDSDANPTTGRTGPITLAIGENKPDNDAGLKDPGTAALTGRMFIDANLNNVDDGEAGIGGQTVKLLNTAGVVIATTTTAADGSYAFTGLDAGNYVVLFPKAVAGRVLVAQNVGTNDAIDSDASTSTGKTGVISVAIGETKPDNDAGFKDPGTGKIGDRVWVDTDGDGVQDTGEAGLAGVKVTLFKDGVAVATQTTDANGNYLFTGLYAGTYRVGFAQPDGYKLTIANIGNDSLDSDANSVTGLTGNIVLGVAKSNLTVDAGMVVANKLPVAANDSGHTCADTAVTVNVLANDSDPDGNPLTITKVAGQSITEGQTITAADGVKITLSSGQLVFNASGTAYEDALVGTSNNATYSYTISDGKGGTATANVDMKFCGVTNTLETIAASLPDTGNMKLHVDYLGGDFYNVTISGTGDARFDGVTFADTYCVSAYEPIATGVWVPFEMYVADAALLPAGIVAHTENLDMVNWILNQDFGSINNGDGTGKTYTEAEIQGAIWGLTDDIVFVNESNPAFGTIANAQEIYNLALANGEGFEAGAGDIVGLILHPTDAAAPASSQPLIIGVPFDVLAVDCMCG